MSNYEIVDSDTKKLVDDVSDRYSHLAGCVVETIFLTKKKMTKGKFELAKLSKPNALVKHIFDMGNINEPDYLLMIDYSVFNALEINDKELLISHALEYADVDMDKDDPYKLRGAEVESFYDEIERTKEDPQWQQRHQDIAANIYSKEKE